MMSKYLTRAELPPNSWQQEWHDKGNRFLRSPSISRKEIDTQDANLRAARLGKTVIESYANREVVMVEQWATSSEIRTTIQTSESAEIVQLAQNSNVQEDPGEAVA